jgi:hypothetical protein
VSCTRTAVDANSRQHGYSSTIVPPTFQRTRTHSFAVPSVASLTCPQREVTVASPQRSPLKCFSRRSTIMAIDPGPRAARFLPQGRRYSFVAKYIARLGLYLHVHKYDEVFNRANRLPGSDLKTAAITEVSKLISFCVCL